MAISPVIDPGRLDAVGRADLFEGDRSALDAIARIAAHVLQVPVGLVSVVGLEEQRFAGVAGLKGLLAETRATPLTHSYCRHVVEGGVPLLVGDARAHPVTRDNPAIEEYDAIAYAGYPITAADGHTLGTVCAMDSRPREWTAENVEALRDLAAVASLVIEARAHLAARQTEPAPGWGAVAVREYFRAVFENTSVGMLIVDAGGGIVRGNAAMDALLGRNTFELLGQHFTSVVHPDDLAASLDAFRRLKNGATDSYPIDERCVRPDGSVVWGRVVARLIRSADGNPLYAVMLKQDVTREKAAISDVRQRDVELGRAERLRALGEVAAGVAHDFNNALSVITACAGMVLSQMPSDTDLREDLEDIEVAARKAAGLTQQLLRLARGQATRFAPVKVQDVVSETAGMLEKAAGSAVEVRTDLAPGAPPILGDRVALQQILMNLVVNARDAMPAGGRVTISVAHVGDAVELTVSDTGTGMTPEIRSRLFEPFFTTKGEGKGTGLGLASVRRIVDDLGGEIAVASEIGVGTAFVVRLPRVSS